jgi:outer membrane protein OmpA-like peptidoglycan-associated protein
VLLFDYNKSIEGKVLNLPRKNLEEIYQTIKSLEKEINLLFDTKKAELLKKAYEQIINILEQANET